jgi:glycerol-3-phosphate dehydrogenase
MPRFASSRRFVRPLLYTTAFGTATAVTLYFTYRPRNIPGSDHAAVPPPHGPAGVFRLPDFPAIPTREHQISQLRRSSSKENANANANDKSTSSWFGGASKPPQVLEAQGEDNDDDVYDLLVIGAGATGAGIALDAATRGLKVACVERDDFSSGTSSKSTKLVHGGVRYLEKAVWELDYSQYVPFLFSFDPSPMTATPGERQTDRERERERELLAPD